VGNVQNKRGKGKGESVATGPREEVKSHHYMYLPTLFGSIHMFIRYLPSHYVRREIFKINRDSNATPGGILRLARSLARSVTNHTASPT